MSNLKAHLIRLGSKNPELQPHLRPVLDALHGKKADISRPIESKEMAEEEWEHLRLRVEEELERITKMIRNPGRGERFYKSLNDAHFRAKALKETLEKCNQLLERNLR